MLNFCEATEQGVKVALIVATGNEGVIGKNNQLPWHLPQDLKYFKATTMNKPIIMGRKTFESIGRALPGRPNIVVSRSGDWSAPGVISALDLESAIAIAVEQIKIVPNLLPEVMVIGGAEIYRAALPFATRIYLTKIDIAIDGDAFFPRLNKSDWEIVSSLDGEVDSQLQHSFLVYERVVQEIVANN